MWLMIVMWFVYRQRGCGRRRERGIWRSWRCRRLGGRGRDDDHSGEGGRGRDDDHGGEGGRGRDDDHGGEGGKRKKRGEVGGEKRGDKESGTSDEVGRTRHQSQCSDAG